MHSVDTTDKGMMSHLGQSGMERDFIHLKLMNYLFLEFSSSCFQTAADKLWKVQLQITNRDYCPSCSRPLQVCVALAGLSLCGYRCARHCRQGMHGLRPSGVSVGRRAAGRGILSPGRGWVHRAASQWREMAALLVPQQTVLPWPLTLSGR